MQDIWVIREVGQSSQLRPEQGFEVYHHQLDGSHWRNEGALPWKEFVGSQKALSSFAMPDTLIYMALPICESPEPHCPQTWMALSDSPSRLLYAAVRGVHFTLIEQVQSMGKEVVVFGLNKGQGEITANAFKEIFSLVSQSEKEEIEKWHRKKSATQTVVNQDWSLGLSLALLGDKAWLKSRLTIGVLVGMLISGLIHLALEGLREQSLRLATQHKQFLAQLETSKPAIQKPTDWAWLSHTLKGTEPERLAVTWDKGGTMQLMLKTEQQNNSRKAGNISKVVPNGCKPGRQGWMVCATEPQNLLDREMNNKAGSKEDSPADNDRE